MKQRFYLLLLFSVGAACLAAAPTPAKVSIYPVDTFGNPLSCYSVQILHRSPENNKIAVHVLDSGVCTIDNVSQGEIDFKVRVMGFPLVQEHLYVRAGTNVNIQAVFSFPFEGGPRTGEIHGTVSLEGESDVWINLVGVFLNNHHATKVDASGRYELKYVEPGAYFLIVSSKGIILANRYLAVRLENDPVNLKLSRQ